MTPDEFADELTDIVSASVERLRKAAHKSQQRIFDDLAAFSKGFDTDATGRIKPTTANLKTLQKIRNRLDRTVANDEWQKAVKAFTDEYRVLELRVKTYLLEEFGNELNPKAAVLETIRENSILLTRQTLIESGLKERLTTQLEPILSRSVTLGTPYRDLIQGTRALLLENDGKLVRWVNQIAMDQQHQFTANYLQTFSQGLDNQWYKYSGGRVADTRSFCEARRGKYWHISEIRSWPSLKWDGKNPNTTPDNIITLRGGYNCLHTLIPVSASRVPVEKRAEFES